MEKLKALLDAVDARDVASLAAMLESSQIGPADVEHEATYSPESYSRKLVFDSPKCQAWVMCWMPGQRSPIHDHKGSACAMMVIKGVATEIKFERTTGQLTRVAGHRQILQGQVCATFDEDIHQIANLDENDLITLHVYVPPLLQMNEYACLDRAIPQYFDQQDDTGDGSHI